jgi:hypothetical protein
MEIHTAESENAGSAQLRPEPMLPPGGAGRASDALILHRRVREGPLSSRGGVDTQGRLGGGMAMTSALSGKEMK